MLTVLPVLAGTLAVKAHGPVIEGLIEAAPDSVTLAVWTAFAGSVAFAGLRYPEGAAAARFLAVGLTLVATAYALALRTDLAIVDADLAARVGPALGHGAPLVALSALLAIWRPAFAPLPFLYVALHKDITRTVAGAAELGRSDYLPLIEVGLFLAVGLCALSLLRGRSIARGLDAEWAGALLLAAAIGAHLGNYFASGMAKVMLDGGPLSWALHNPTAALMLGGYNLGTAPLSAWPALFDWAHGLLQAVEVPLNVVTLGAQLLCFLAFVHRRALIGFALFFDAMHIAIFLLTGALFVTWIALNTLIVAAVARWPGDRIRPSAMLLGALVTVLGSHVFWQAQLGWYDGRQVRHAYFVAVDAQGDEHRVPSNFFREASYVMLGRQFGYREHGRPSTHAPTSSWGQIGIQIAAEGDGAPRNVELMRQAQDCAIPVSPDVLTPDYDAAAVAAFVRGHHRRAVERAAAERPLGYHLYPHHHVALPHLFRGFDALDPRNIVAYRYVVETVCLDSRPDGLERRVLARTSTEVPLDG